MNLRRKNIFKLAVSIILTQLAGVLGSLFTSQSIDNWYEELIKPSFTPPDWLFAPVWIILYLLMGIALYLVWRQGEEKPEVRNAIIIFGIQLGLNVLWTMVFFGLESIVAGLIVIILLWLAVLLTIIKFYKISKTAALLLIPYILWLTYAAVLNFSIWKLNS